MKQVFGDDWAEKCYLTGGRSGEEGTIKSGDISMTWDRDGGVGKLLTTAHINGTVSDVGDNVAAKVEFYTSGNIHTIIHYRDGWISCEGGQPSETTLWENGNLKTTSYYDKNQLINPPNGEPAYVTFTENGDVSSGEIVTDNNELRHIGAEETEKMMAAAKAYDLNRLCAGETVICGKSSVWHITLTSRGRGK